MKKLRFFDSLKIMRAMFVAVVVATAFILNVAHADTNTIQSVIAYGKTEQNGTPTPTNPVPIMTNNGVLKYKSGKNLFDINDLNIGSVASDNVRYKSYAVPNGTYTMSTPDFPTVSSTANIFFFAGDVSSGASSASNGVLQGTSRTINVTNGYYTIGYRSGMTNPNNPKNYSWQIEQGSTATAYEPYSGPTGIYVDGMVETIRDSAGHTARAQMLLGLNDEYRDEQNITTGAITRRVGVKVLDGTGTWGSSSTYGATVYLQSAASNEFSPAAAKEKIISNYFVGEGVASTVTTHPENTCFFNSTGHLYFRTSKTPAEFKAWLAEQYANGTPVIVVYPLATETTEPDAVAPQRLTTAPVRQTLGAIMNMPIKTILTDNTEIMSGANELIKIATTKYNEESFEDVQDALTGVFNAVDTVVTQTMTQAQAIDQIANNKQTRPVEGCSAKYCLLVEDEQGVPHWYPIAGANGVAHNLPAGYTELEYLESTASPSQAYINTGLNFNSDYMYEITYAKGGVQNAIMGARKNAGYSAVGNFSVTYCNDVDTCVYSSTENASNSVVLLDTVFGTKHTIKYQQSTSTLLFDNTNKWGAGWVTQTSIPYNMYLFAFNSAGTAGGSRTGYVRIYSYSVKNANGAFVQNFIPARRDSDGVLGMYDLADANPATAFHTNAGTGTFVAGPDM